MFVTGPEIFAVMKPLFKVKTDCFATLAMTPSPLPSPTVQARSFGSRVYPPLSIFRTSVLISFMCAGFIRYLRRFFSKNETFSGSGRAV